MNYMENIAEMLGVELNEKFSVIDSGGGVFGTNFYFSRDGLKDGGLNNKDQSGILNMLLTGRWSVRKLPWKPKITEFYYYIDNDNGDVRWTYWVDSIMDFSLYKFGKVYHTAKEAEAHREEDMKFWYDIRRELER